MPENCISVAKLLTFPTRYSQKPVVEAFRRVLWKFSDGSLGSEAKQLTLSDLYWLLRTAHFQDETGCMGILAAVDEYIEHRFLNSYTLICEQCESAEKGNFDPIYLKNCITRLQSVFMYAFLEGLENKADFNLKKTLTPIELHPPVPTSLDTSTISCDSNGRMEIFSLVEMVRAHSYGNLDPIPLQLTVGDKKLIDNLREDYSIFKSNSASQNPVAWKPCVVGYSMVRYLYMYIQHESESQISDRYLW